MKSHRYASARALCPYYHAQEAQRIFCRGLQENSGLHLAFRVPDDRQAYGRRYCEDRFEDCPLCTMHMQLGQ